MFCYLHPAPLGLKKLVVKWDSRKFQFVATHPNTNVTGYSDTSPGEAVRNWQYWWNFPF